MISFRPEPLFDKQASIVFVYSAQLQSKLWLQAFPPDIRQALQALRESERFKADQGEAFPLLVKKRLLLVVGLGHKDPGVLPALRLAARQALGADILKNVSDIEIVPADQDDSAVTALIEGLLIGGYSWEKYRPKNEKIASPNDRSIAIVAKEKKAFQETILICDGVTCARDLVNDNADVVHAQYFEDAVLSVIRGSKQASLKVLNEEELKDKGLNLHLAVNRGSPYPPKLIIVKYRGGSKDARFTALVGKGITFDAGGLNLKPTGFIETMRCDMSGAAALLGVLKNVIALNLKKNLIFAFGLAENAIGSRAYKPGDVIRSYSGKTVEIGNTDAEGRLVLADALAYVIRQYNPARVIDIATLTGACVVALGYDYSGLVATSEAMANKLLSAAETTDDRLWRLPSYPELKDSVESQVADIKNIGFPKGAGGTITAAEFLRQFTDGKPWAHIDIAGTAFRDGKGRGYYGPGATGAGVRLLTEFVRKN